nr:hypothetical protein [Phytohabitans rumicis]
MWPNTASVPPGASAARTRWLRVASSSQCHAIAHAISGTPPAGGAHCSNVPRCTLACGNRDPSTAAIRGSGSTQVSGAPSRASTAVPLPVPAPNSTTSPGTPPW